MTLSENEYRVLNVLLKDPSLSYTEIAQTIGLSVTSIRNLLFSLMEYGDSSSFEEDGITPVKTNSSYVNLEYKPNKLSFYCKFNYDMLNLRKVDFFISCSSIYQMENATKFCDAHPYTAFISRIYGGENGLFVIFILPPNSLDMLLFCFEVLKQENLIDNYNQIIKFSRFTIYSALKVDVFDANQDKWNFTFEDFKSKLTDYAEKTDSPNHFEIEGNQSILEKLDKIDIMILNEWGYAAGPRKTKAELLNNLSTGKIYAHYVKGLKLNRYIISDHVDSLLKQNIINNIGIGFDRRKIQILATLFYSGIADSKFLNTFANFIQDNVFPFESTFNVGDLDSASQTAHFTWWVSFTPDIVSKFTEFLYENSLQLQTFIVTSNIFDIENYPLYHANFICDSPNSGHWNTSEENFINGPLEVFFDTNKVQKLSTDFQKIRKPNKE